MRRPFSITFSIEQMLRDASTSAACCATFFLRNAVDASTTWSLPPRILASKQKEGYVPFPVVHACDDIPRNRELLCLYRETRLKTCGGACASPLRDDYMGPVWHDV